MPLERRKNKRVFQNSAPTPTATISMDKPFFQEPFQVEINDMSDGGLMVYSREMIPLFYEFDLDIHVPEQPVVRRKGKAVYHVSSDLGFNTGIKFDELEGGE